MAISRTKERNSYCRIIITIIVIIIRINLFAKKIVKLYICLNLNYLSLAKA